MFLSRTNSSNNHIRSIGMSMNIIIISAIGLNTCWLLINFSLSRLCSSAVCAGTFQLGVLLVGLLISFAHFFVVEQQV